MYVQPDEPLLYAVMEERYSPLASALLGLLIVAFLVLVGSAVNISAEAQAPDYRIGMAGVTDALDSDARPTGDITLR